MRKIKAETGLDQEQPSVPMLGIHDPDQAQGRGIGTGDTDPKKYREEGQPHCQLV